MPRFDGRFFPGSKVTDWAAGKFGKPGWYPDPPTSVTPTEGDLSVSLELVPGDANGQDITGYIVERNSGSWSVHTSNTGSASTTYNVTGLTNGTAYTFRIKAINGVGESQTYSVVSASKTPRGVPSAPTGFSLANGTNVWEHVNLSWSAGATNGSAITGYKIQRKTGSGGTYADLVASTGNTNTTYTDGPSGVAATTEYYYRIAQITAGGTSAYATEANHTTGAEPFAATGGTVTTHGSYKVHTFTGSGSLHVSTGSETVSAIVVAGGAGGGTSYGGGGGGGGVVVTTFTANKTYNNGGLGYHPITIGAGGNEATGNYNQGNYSTGPYDGNDSTVVHAGGTITAEGGGFGASKNPWGTTGYDGGDGGCGGGCCQSGTGGDGSQGGDGGDLSWNGIPRGGGGGGGGPTDGGGNSNTFGGAAGGSGKVNDYQTGSNQYYAGGGGGCSGSPYYPNGAGGSGGGSSCGGFWGYAGRHATVPDATVNTGGGGAGGTTSWGAGAGSGASGIVILRYPA